MPLPSDQLRQAVMDAIAKSRLGVRRFEAKHGLHKWELRGILDPARRQSPSVDKARKICEALGLEFYIGPPRKSTITELKEKLLTQEEQKAIPPEVERALESIVADRLDQEKLLSEAAAPHRKDPAATGGSGLSTPPVDADSHAGRCTGRDRARPGPP